MSTLHQLVGHSYEWHNVACLQEAQYYITVEGAESIAALYKEPVFRSLIVSYLSNSIFTFLVQQSALSKRCKMNPFTSSSPPPESSTLSTINTQDLESIQQPIELSITSTTSTIPRSRKPTEKHRIRTSFVWSHMPGPANTIYQKGVPEVIYWRCKYCPKEYRESGGTAHIAGHLRAIHKVIDTPQEQQKISQQLSISAAMERGLETQHKRRRLDTIQSNTIDPSTLEQLFIRWISRCSVSFRMTEIPEFRDLLLYLNPEVNNWLPTSHNTIHKWTIRSYNNERTRVIQAVQSALSKIHFTVDLWTSTNNLALLGIIGHYITENGELRQSILGLREVHGRHTGENQASIVVNVIREFGIASKIGYFMMDNATNNDTMINALSGLLFDEYKIQYNAIHHRLRCNGHIINLVAKAFLFGHDEDAFSTINNPGVVDIPTDLEMEIWRQKGPLGKLHNIVVFIQRSPQREEGFLQLSHGKHLLRDQQTRWNSWFAMIDRAIQTDIKVAIDLYCFQHATDIQLDTLTAED